MNYESVKLSIWAIDNFVFIYYVYLQFRVNMALVYDNNGYLTGRGTTFNEDLDLSVDYITPMKEVWLLECRYTDGRKINCVVYFENGHLKRWGVPDPDPLIDFRVLEEIFHKTEW